MSIAARLPSSTSVWVTAERNARCVLLNTAINASTISDISDTTTKISTSENARALRGANASLFASNDPLSVRNDPLSVRNDPLSARNDPLSARNDSLSVRNDPLSVRNDPLSVRNDPLSVRNGGLRRAKTSKIKLFAALPGANDPASRGRVAVGTARVDVKVSFTASYW